MRICPIFFLAVLLAGSAARAQTISIVPERASATYRLNEPVRWRITVTDAAKLRDATYAIKAGGLNAVASGALTLSGDAAVLESKLAEPGWLLLEVDGKDAAGANLQAFGGALVAPEQIAAAAARPDDFEAFWAEKREELAAVPIGAAVTPGVSNRAGVDYATVQLDGIRGTHVQGQLARPSATGKYPALLIPQWAGVYSLQKDWATYRASEGWLVLNIQAHDIAPIEADAYYQALANGALKDYSRIGNEDRETGYFLRMFLACRRAAEYLTTRPDWDGRTLVVMGASQGGMQALVTAALDPKVTAVIAEVPAGCDQAGLDVGRQPGWPVWVWQAWDRDAAKVKQTSRYFDVVNFMPLIRCPVLLGVGLLDTTVPPPGVYAAHRQLTGARQILAMPGADHVNNHAPFAAPQNAWLLDARTARAPTIRVAPQPVSARAGQAVSFAVVADNGQAFGYQWLKDGAAIPGATEARLSLASVAAADEADYAVVVTSPGGVVTSAPARLALVGGPAISPKTTLANLSARLDCGVGSNVAIGGFVITGPGVKRVLLRAVGPSLTAQGLSEAEVLHDPIVELHDASHGNAIVATNDDWGENGDAVALAEAAGRVGAAALQAGDFTSSALLLDLPAGIFTFVVKGKEDTRGIVLLEVYDADAGRTGTSLSNIASRARAGTGAAVAIGGFVIAGQAPKTVLLRAVGPTLATQGLGEAEVLRDPAIELHDALRGNATIAVNADWGDAADAGSITATGSRVGATPLAAADLRSAALLATLAPGVYSFIAKGADEAGGVVLVEVYDAD